MSDKSATADEVRQKILKRPDVILEDPAVMRVLADAGDRSRGQNVVDMRGIAMDRLEKRLGRLEDTHRNVIAAAYDNLAGTNQVHRAVLAMLEPVDFAEFIRTLCGEVAHILRVDRARLVLESHQESTPDSMAGLDGIVLVGEPGFVDDYVTHGRDIPVRQVTLRGVHPEEGGLYGTLPGQIGSEACLRLDLGSESLPAMLAFGAYDRYQFSPDQGTDLLEFLADATERAMRRWLA